MRSTSRSRAPASRSSGCRRRRSRCSRTSSSSGMTTPHRPRILGDIGENAPERWDWGGPSGAAGRRRCCCSMRPTSRRCSGSRTSRSPRSAGGLAVPHRLGTSDLDGFEPFGFRDGISQPLVEGLSKTGPPERRSAPASSCSATRTSTASTRTGRCSTRPHDPATCSRATRRARPRRPRAQRQLPRLPPAAARTCRGFWRFVDEATRRADGSSDPDARLRLAAKMVGRWPSGAPLALAPDADDPALADANDFAYHELDRARRPLPDRRPHPARESARLARPAARERATRGEINRRHRILRRGREYGTSLTIEQALAGDDRRARPPLHLPERQHPRQFEFINHTWLNNPKFDRLYDDADPARRRRRRRTAARSRSRPTASASA